MAISSREQTKMKNLRKKLLCLYMVFPLTLVLLSGVSRVYAQLSTVEMTPYAVSFILVTGEDPTVQGLGSELRNDLKEMILSRIGGGWTVTEPAVTKSFRAVLLTQMEKLTFSDIPAELRKGDKLILMTLVRSSDMPGFMLCTREVDISTQRITGLLREQVPDAACLCDVAFRMMMCNFTPSGMIESVEMNKVALRMRAGRILTPQPGILHMNPGDVGMVLIRYNAADGTARRITPVMWTYLVVEPKTDDMVRTSPIMARVETGIRAPFSNRRAGRVEQIVLKVHPSTQTSTLFLHGKKQEDGTLKPLVGYTVYSHEPGSKTPTLIGRTDWRGKFIVEPEPDKILRILLVKNGPTILARLPVVPGIISDLEAEIPDVDKQIEAEGVITGLQEEMVDLIAWREILIARIHARMEAEDLDQAELLLTELRELKTHGEFKRRLGEQQKLLFSPEAAVQARIDKLFKSTYIMLDKYYRTNAVEQITQELKAARNQKKAE